MSTRALTRMLLVYAVLLSLACALVWRVLHLDPTRAPSSRRIVSVWCAGARSARVIATSAEQAARVPAAAGCKRVTERIVDEGPLIGTPTVLLAISVVAGRDGIAAELDGKTAYLTPDDLLAQQAARNGAQLGALELRIGLDDANSVLDKLAAELQVDRAQLQARGRLRRFVVQSEGSAWPLPAAAVSSITPQLLRESIRSAGAYLVRIQEPDGRFAYELDAISGESQPGYNWPRHGGATLTLAQVGSALGDRRALDAALRASRLLQQSLTVDCGELKCIGDSTRVDAGAAALALLAYTELIQAGAGDEFRSDAIALAKFLRSLQRQDGELMHVYDRDARRALDIQLPYYTGEVVLALARAARISDTDANLRAASRGLSFLVRRGLYQNRYSYGAEHWTCQALEELWDRAPDLDALAFCLDHQTYNRMYQLHDGNPIGDYAGGIASNAFAPPRFAPTGSRGEGAVATLTVARKAQLSAAELAPLEAQVQSSIRFFLRYQLRPGPVHLMRDAARMHGAWPGSPVDLHVRIDYPQHVAGTMLRYLRLLEPKR